MSHTATCDRCGHSISPEDADLGWPVPTVEGAVCPSCYGEEAYCPEGHVLRGDTDSQRCERCDHEIEAA